MTIPAGIGGSQGDGGISYVLPLRRWSPVHAPDPLTGYLRWLSTQAEVIVVDGSDSVLFDAHHSEWARFVTHVAVAPDLVTRNGKVGGVMTGVRLASHEALIVADDDVRYDGSTLRLTVAALVGNDLVRPQNYFDPLPWHARWDTARTLLNRSFGGDFPGTFALRRNALLARGGYSGDVLFENLELIRSMTAIGARIANRPDLLVRRRPPAFSDFMQQRVRHAYESFAQPKRLVSELAILPTFIGIGYRRRWRMVAFIGGISIGLAEMGRWRHNGRSVFPASSALLAPAWLAERAVCSWIAVGLRIRGGIRYAGTTLTVAAHSIESIRATRASGGSADTQR